LVLIDPVNELLLKVPPDIGSWRAPFTIVAGETAVVVTPAVCNTLVCGAYVIVPPLTVMVLLDPQLALLLLLLQAASARGTTSAEPSRTTAR
jgi:hypothetical protein